LEINFSESNILVDYDNLPTDYKLYDLQTMAESIIDLIINDINYLDKINFRLYGGWFIEESFSIKAQELLRQYSDILGKYYLYKKSSKIVRYSINLVYSVLAKPNYPLYYTHRMKRYPGGLSMHKPEIVCNETIKCTPCNMLLFYNYFTNSDKSFCKRSRRKFFFRKEQKMVDTMIVSDLLYLAHNEGQRTLFVVSSDDDMVPGIITSINMKKTILIDLRNFNFKYQINSNNFEIRRCNGS